MAILAAKTNLAKVLAAGEFLTWFSGLLCFACEVNALRNVIDVTKKLSALPVYPLKICKHVISLSVETSRVIVDRIIVPDK